MPRGKDAWDAYVTGIQSTSRAGARRSRGRVVARVPEGMTGDQAERILAAFGNERDAARGLLTQGLERAPDPEPFGEHEAGMAARTERAWRGIEARWGLLTAEDVARAGGSQAVTTRSFAANLRRNRRVLAVARGRRLRYPGFQFGPDGRVLPVIAEIAEMAGAAGWSDAAVLLWLAAPTGWLPDGVLPADLLAGDPAAVLAVFAQALGVGVE